MGNGIIAFLVAISASVWIYSKLMRNTGGNASSAITASVISAVVIFLLALFALGFIPK